MRLRRLAKLEGVPESVTMVTIVASFAAVLFAYVQGWPGWAIVAAAVLPWFVPFAFETTWLGRHYGWFALLYVLTITQTGHLIEHVSQMVQMHVLNWRVANGVIGVLNIDWVHFGWNTWVLLAIYALAFRFRRNPWILTTAVLATWHEVEHIYLLSLYLRNGVTGLPGLLDKGGLIGGGLPIKGPDLHFIYNLAETIPLIGAFFYELGRLGDGQPTSVGSPLAPSVGDATRT